MCCFIAKKAKCAAMNGPGSCSLCARISVEIARRLSCLEVPGEQGIGRGQAGYPPTPDFPEPSDPPAVVDSLAFAVSSFSAHFGHGTQTGRGYPAQNAEKSLSGRGTVHHNIHRTKVEPGQYWGGANPVLLAGLLALHRRVETLFISRPWRGPLWLLFRSLILPAIVSGGRMFILIMCAIRERTLGRMRYNFQPSRPEELEPRSMSGHAAFGKHSQIFPNEP
ncbi:hypothetical protein B0I35DRAFT_14204 [Stachybotrys elegans]|uniref:Uncharacterized protein n=1 Tax=Stachybotrys elegans TaxID=80388 RepID=A0A8K0WXX3_9HYPO|nr:hypothetical protein B0I35DRAFT_14204 [Stachybotrys elegans]